jgi:ribosomal-protein-alanine N-acetyltransferase
VSAILKDSPPQLRPMREHDLQRVIGVEQRSYEFPWSIGIFADCLRVGYCCWVLADGDRLCGHGIMAIAADEAHVLNICVDPDYRRLGLARQLLAHLLFVSTDHQAQIVFLEVRPSNTGAIELYRQTGFSQIAVRRAYYPATVGREDALVLGKTLK